MLPANAQTETRRPSGKDRTGEMRYLDIASFDSSHFPTVLVGESEYIDVTLPPRTRADGTVIPARVITTERCWAVSQRTNLDGEPFLAYTNENVDIRFMPLRDEAIVGLDATEDGEKLTAAQLTQLVAANFQEFLKSRIANPTVEAEVDLDTLPL